MRTSHFRFSGLIIVALKNGSLLSIFLTFFILGGLLAPSVPYANDLLLEHSPNPLQAESQTAALEPWETPISGFFIRSHLGVPALSKEIEKQCILQIDGLVERPLRLTLADLRKMAFLKNHAVLECSGNRRGQQQPPVPGVQWQRGAVGNAEWGGVSVAEVLAKAGVKSNAKFARLEGADQPTLPSVPGFIRSVPIEKILKKDTLIAWMMNREPLPVLHGGPIRLVLPNWYGENWIKWLTHITLTETEDTGFFMKKGYRVPKQPVAPGEKWDSSTGAPIEQLLVQSFIVFPAQNQTVQAGEIPVRGKTFSGAGPIVSVELSSDEGKHWTPAQVEPPHLSGGWQEFSATLIAQEKGPLTILARAKDSQGNQQPLQPQWNPAGYIDNSCERIRITVGSEITPDGSTLISQHCITCHSRDLIENQRLSPQQWDGVLKKMETFGVHLSPTERSSILHYVEKKSPDQSLRTPRNANYTLQTLRLTIPSGNSKQGAQLYTQHCKMCHGDQGEGNIGPRLKGRAIDPAVFLSVALEGRNQMPAFKALLKQQQIVDIQYYLEGVGSYSK